MSSERIRAILECIDRLKRGDLAAPFHPSGADDELAEIERALSGLCVAMEIREDLYQAAQQVAVNNSRRLDHLATELSRANAINQQTIQALSSPIIQVAEGIIMMPVFGSIDKKRGECMMAALLDAVANAQSKYVIIDLTGAVSVDPNLSNEIVKLVNAVRLLGAKGIVVGIQPDVARRIVSNGIDLSRIPTLATLREALDLCTARSSAEAIEFAAPGQRKLQRG